MIKKTILFASAAFLVACGSNSTEKSEGTEAVVDTAKKEVVTQPTNELADFKFRTLVINIPSPFEIISLLQKSGTAYKADLANATDNAKKYTTTTKKGLNYGVYIVDLVYLSSNDHFSEVKNYFTTSAGIAKSLEFSDSFEHIVGSRFENNIDKKDSINVIMDQVYTEMDNYLRSNDRLLTATQILVGSWIESQYIATSQLKDEAQTEANKVSFQKLLDQSFASKKLIDILKDYEKEKELKSVIDGIKELDKLYSGLHTEKDMTKAELEKSLAKLKDIRSKIVN